MPLIKICGLNDEASLDASLDAGADMVGFVIFEPSPRHVPFGRARELGNRVRERARKVALTVDASDGTLAEIIKTLKPDLLQLHGRETPKRTAAVRARFGLPVMRAISVGIPTDLETVTSFEAIADYLLFDARPPADAARPGGHGSAFDWSLLKGVATSQPWFLAGGLTDANVADALATTRAPGVDVSSGVESAPGRKDPDKINRFVANARAAET